MSVKKSVSHFINGKAAWQVGLIGLLIRYTGIALTLLITFALSGIALWLSTSLPSSFTINTSFFVTALVFAMGGILASLLYYLRIRTIRSLKIKHSLHVIAHDIRDIQTELHEKFLISDCDSANLLNDELERLLTVICNNVAIHFKLLTNDRSICAAIRLASLEEGSDEIVYKTFARSEGLNRERKKFSESISINKGIPRFLREDKKARGVLIYNDLEMAAKDGTYIITESDRQFPDDIITMMVAPLNAWSGVSEDMLGIIFITSQQKDTFKVKHVDSLAFLADLTAVAVSNTIEFVNLKCEYMSQELTS